MLVKIIKVVCVQCCPGYVSTDMTRHKGTLTVDEGAKTLCWLATLPPSATTPAGQFCYEMAVGDFENGKFPS